MGLDVGEIGMGADLSLDLKMFAARSLGRAVKDAPASAMDDCIRRLEEEKGKIKVFRRELPLCACLLADGDMEEVDLLAKAMATIVSTIKHPDSGSMYATNGGAATCQSPSKTALKKRRIMLGPSTPNTIEAKGQFLKRQLRPGNSQGRRMKC